jgi:hypothetical protein
MKKLIVIFVLFGCALIKANEEISSKTVVEAGKKRKFSNFDLFLKKIARIKTGNNSI